MTTVMERSMRAPFTTMTMETDTVSFLHVPLRLNGGGLLIQIQRSHPLPLKSAATAWTTTAAASKTMKTPWAALSFIWIWTETPLDCQTTPNVIAKTGLPPTLDWTTPTAMMKIQLLIRCRPIFYRRSRMAPMTMIVQAKKSLS